MKRKKIKIARIEIDRDLCIGAGSCIALAPRVFKFDKKFKAILKKYNASQISFDDIYNAACSCPTKAIRLYDESGKEIPLKM
ncbi:MAG: ferredoxin [Parcubacteria group bacterium]|nr:ferredoxin [Parcubacteria group bacterium]